MLRTTVALMGILAFAGFQAPAMAGGCAGCTKVAKGADGFCCGNGRTFGVETKSKKLHAALVGHKVDLEKHPCKGCRKAGETNGSCSYCKTYAVDGTVYHSKVAYALAKGTPMPKELVEACPKRCSTCKSAHAENGRCKECNVGFVANRMYDGEEAFKVALAAFKTLKKAAMTAKNCETCAVAIVTDGECTKCKVTFKNGKVAS